MNKLQILSVIYLSITVWPQPIWIKVRTWWQIPPQHQSTYLGGPESASIEIPPFRPFLWSKFSKIKIFKNFWIAPNFCFALQCIKNRLKVVPWKNSFCSWKKKIVSLKKILKKKILQKFSDRFEFFFCFAIHKKWNKSCSLDKFFLFLKKKVVSLKKTSFEIFFTFPSL